MVCKFFEPVWSRYSEKIFYNRKYTYPRSIPADFSAKAAGNSETASARLKNTLKIRFKCNTSKIISYR